MPLLNVLPLLITAVGIYFLVRLKFFFLIHPVITLKKITARMREPSARRSLSLALAGTLGVGNIAGVAYGLSVGGAGTLFWIFVSGLFAAVIKYAESALAAHFHTEGHGGIQYVIGSSFGKVGKLLGTVWTVLCLLLSLTMGAPLQTRSIAEALTDGSLAVFGAVTLIFVILLIAATSGGVRKIEKLTEIIIPVSTVVYIILCIGIILANMSRMPSVLSEILEGAFSLKSAAGGTSSVAIAVAMREGYSRGLLSNEAGAGTSAMAQSRAPFGSAAEVGLFGMCEAVFDTSLLCTATGLAVLASGVPFSSVGGMATVASAVRSVYGSAAVALLFILVFAFAFSTVVCWYFYGTECVSRLFGSKLRGAFSVLFVASAAVGFFAPSRYLITVTDYLLFFMSLLTLSALIKNSERVVRLSEQYGLLKKSDMGK